MLSPALKQVSEADSMPQHAVIFKYQTILPMFPEVFQDLSTSVLYSPFAFKRVSRIRS